MMTTVTSKELSNANGNI